MKQKDTMNYARMKRAELVTHCLAYSEALHKLATEVQKLRLVKYRLKNLEKLRRHLHGK